MNFEYKTDHISKTKSCKNRKVVFSFVSEHCASFWNKNPICPLLRGGGGGHKLGLPHVIGTGSNFLFDGKFNAIVEESIDVVYIRCFDIVSQNLYSVVNTPWTSKSHDMFQTISWFVYTLLLSSSKYFRQFHDVFFHVKIKCSLLDGTHYLYQTGQKLERSDVELSERLANLGTGGVN